MLKRLVVLLAIICSCVADEDSCPNIITRNQWSNVKAKSVNYLIVPVPYVVIHHTVTPECNSRAACGNRVENIRSYHMDNLGWHDIGYSFLVGGDGNIYEGCGWTHEGAHTLGYNKKSVAIAFIGNFQEKDAGDNMLNAAHQLIQCGISKGILRDDVKVIAARQVRSTASPGVHLYNQIQNWEEWSSEP